MEANNLYFLEGLKMSMQQLVKQKGFGFSF
jgi:hypothetical protein